MYKVNDIFLSPKGEGVHIGVPMNFVRLAYCNLACTHCDTTFNSPVMPMSVEDILGQLHPQCSAVVITGGEPTMQDLSELITVLHEAGYRVHLESNGTLSFPTHRFDWICISPKIMEGAEPLPENISAAHEIKMPVRTQADIDEAERFRSKYPDVSAVWYLHPWNSAFEQFVHGKQLSAGARNMEGYSADANKLCVDHALKTGRWRISIQLHKVLGVK